MTEQTLREKETFMLYMVEEVLEGGISLEQAAKKYGISKRTVRRKVNAYVLEGAGGLIHKSRGRVPTNKTDERLVCRCVELYENNYLGYNFTHFHQKLKEQRTRPENWFLHHFSGRVRGYEYSRQKRRRKHETNMLSLQGLRKDC